jgi:hypothetical protein
MARRRAPLAPHLQARRCLGPRLCCSGLGRAWCRGLLGQVQSVRKVLTRSSSLAHAAHLRACPLLPPVCTQCGPLVLGGVGRAGRRGRWHPCSCRLCRGGRGWVGWASWAVDGHTAEAMAGRSASAAVVTVVVGGTAASPWEGTHPSAGTRPAWRLCALWLLLLREDRRKAGQGANGGTYECLRLP